MFLHNLAVLCVRSLGFAFLCAVWGCESGAKNPIERELHYSWIRCAGKECIYSCLAFHPFLNIEHRTRQTEMNHGLWRWHYNCIWNLKLQLSKENPLHSFFRNVNSLLQAFWKIWSYQRDEMTYTLENPWMKNFYTKYIERFFIV